MRIKRLVIIFFLFVLNLDAAAVKKERVDLAVYDFLLLPIEQLAAMYPYFEQIESFPLKYARIREKYEMMATYDLYTYVKQFFSDTRNLKKIIFFDYCEDPKIFKLPKSKMVLFKWEAIKIPDYFYDPYSIVYTCDDDLIDGIKFFKFYYPALLPMEQDLFHFEEKKLCTLIASNWTLDRVKMVEFFESKSQGDFEFYGVASGKFAESKMYRGSIPGYHSGKEKLSTLKKYRFCICFENTHTTNGYITEKIFNCFAAGCVPVYWGPDNVETYIPANCFIDYRDFQSNEELYFVLKTMSKETYEEYIENIRQFLHSEKAQLFSPDSFDQILFEAANQ